MKSYSFLNGFKRFPMVKNYGMKKKFDQIDQETWKILKKTFRDCVRGGGKGSAADISIPPGALFV